MSNTAGEIAQFSYRVVCDNCDYDLGWANMEEAKEAKKAHEMTNPHTARIVEGDK